MLQPLFAEAAFTAAENADAADSVTFGELAHAGPDADHRPGIFVANDDPWRSMHRTGDVLMQVCAADPRSGHLDDHFARTWTRVGKLFNPHVFAAVINSCAHLPAYLKDRPKFARPQRSWAGVSAEAPP